MKGKSSPCPARWRLRLIFLILPVLMMLNAGAAFAGETLYRNLSAAAKNKDSTLFTELTASGRTADWATAEETAFEGNLRFLEGVMPADGEPSGLFMVRRLDGQLFIVSIPPAREMEKTGTARHYANLKEMLGNKLVFKALLAEGIVNGKSYTYIRFLEPPAQLMLDRIFKVSIVLMFFFVMLGMGLNLTVNDFKLVVQKPKGIAVGILLQWFLMPLLALGMAYALGFYHNFPFIYAGLVLICACPGGVTSNLMTYYAKGDLALSISLTSISTLLALFFTPLIMTVLCANIPDINIPTGLIVQTIIVLVIVPLILGMSIRHKWLNFAVKTTPFFSALGVIALLLVIGVGLYTNVEKFAETHRYSVVFYIMVVFLSVMGMLLAAFVPKLFRIENYQARAISIEVGLRNSTLAITIALLIQDLMGDFYSSMFVTTAIYGITMYITGFLMILLYKKILPLEAQKS
ncbi:MAG: bile acid:sodium symporter family protein [Smithellaceae bacterium]|jgi:bile acid:Na+ symporter, BASS family|nr:bile acid:sodium symporter family protein [Smithellaceae bacterium]MDD3257858.1 bile acid:sodium symporter family protein [Smithellaceae bacterium]MDD3847808.1 bile acid:sodium symporter family protein [Smithellaceae bacterium]HOC61036.1 bile acid:sodium symporter family protein [Smithellaceae bacterium]